MSARGARRAITVLMCEAETNGVPCTKPATVTAHLRRSLSAANIFCLCDDHKSRQIFPYWKYEMIPIDPDPGNPHEDTRANR